MKVKMLEYFQGTGQPTLEPDKEYEVGQELGAWLVKHHKAELLPEPKNPEPETKEVVQAATESKPAYSKPTIRKVRK